MSLQSFLDPKKQSEETTIDTDRYISYSIIPLLPLESIFLSDKGQINHCLRVKRRQSQPYYASRCFPSLSSFLHRSSIRIIMYLLFNAACTRLDPIHPSSFSSSLQSIHFYLMKLSSTDCFTHTDHARVYCLLTACAQGVLSATPNVVRASSDRMSERRAGDAGLDQRLANPSERTAKFHEMMHPLFTI